MFQLKSYQLDTLEALETYLENSRLSGDPKKAFEDFVTANPTDSGQQKYKVRQGMDGVPYVCLRLPTGGGKTVLASHTIEIAARAYLEEEFPVVLWLVPTNTIRQQTLEALKQNDHPYREAIDNAFDGRVSVFDIAEVTRIRPKDLDSRVCVIVGTLQTLRVKNTDGRRIYAHNENFEPHFSKISNGTPGLEKDDEGNLKLSFVNILHYHRPLIIMDEAHKAKSSLSAEVVERINPACVVEFTATPTMGNVLYRVSPMELKAEEMVKLPFMLTEHKNWRNAVNRAVTERRSLEKTASGDADYIRPIALIQAAPQGQEATVKVIKQHLIENENVTEGSIAIATGNQRELDGINLFDKRCPIKYIITIEALKEGWDCPFAYVFCSTQTVRSAVDIEQLLGRVMRMPYAKRREIDELNKAYAHVISHGFAEAAQEMHDKLMNMGFEDDEALDNLVPTQAVFDGFEDTPLGRAAQETPPLVFEVTEKPDLSRVRTFEEEKLKVEKTEAGYQIKVDGHISEDQAEELVKIIPEPEQEKVRRIIKIHRDKFQRPPTPYEKGVSFAVPLLGVLVEGDLELASRDLCLELHGWDLDDYPARFEGNEFVYDDEAQTFEFDIKGNKIVYSYSDETPIFQRGYISDKWDEPRLVRWLDRELHKMGEGAEFRQEVMMEFIRKCVHSLLNSGDFDILALVRAKFLLAKALFEKIGRYREQAYVKGFQATLLDGGVPVEASFNFSFDFKNNAYPSAGEAYRGAYKFKKHYYGNDRIRDLGRLEEFRCAQAIDSAKQVKHWVRNLPWGKEASFRLPTSTDYFYPDFIAELEDGRLFAVEYKGAHLKDDPDTLEKVNIGKLWEEKSQGRCIFLLGVDSDDMGRDIFAQLQSKVG